MLCILATVRPSDDKTRADDDDDKVLQMVQQMSAKKQKQKQELEEQLEKQKHQNDVLQKEQHTMRLAQEVSFHVIPHRPCCAYCAWIAHRVFISLRVSPPPHEQPPA